MELGDYDMLRFIAQDLLVDELNHRFYNCLQVICSASNGLLDLEERCRVEAVRRFQDRIASVADAHRLVARPSHKDSMGTTIRALCAALAGSFDHPPASIRVHVLEGGITPLRRRLLLMLVTELVTNAFKHGDHALFDGIDVELDASAETARLIVRNRSASMDGTPTPPRVATQLVEALGGLMVIRFGDRCVVTVEMPPLSTL